jgi:hypothetical protein
MSQKNLDVFQEANDAFRRGDWDVVIRTDPRWPEQRFYGREAVIAWSRGLWESWGPDFRFEEMSTSGTGSSFVGATSFVGSTAVSRESSTAQ